MKGFKKLLTGILAATLIMGSSMTAFADEPASNEAGAYNTEETTTHTTTHTITINRDDSWKTDVDEENGESNKATYTYYKIFDAKVTTSAEVDKTTGATTKAGVAVYTISGDNAAEKVAALPEGMFKADLASDGSYYITLANENTSASKIAEDLKTMVDGNKTLFPGKEVTSDANPVVIDELEDGYYLIEASNGSVLAVQTLDDVTINEKNDYPTIDKKQKNENVTAYQDEKLTAAIGSYIDYEVTVKIPENVSKAIAVIDVMSSGLEYDSTTRLTVTPNVSFTDLTAEDEGYDESAAWQIKFSDDVVKAHKGEDLVITFRAKVTEDALEDTDRENEVTLNYDNSNYILKDKVEYTTYYTGIEKVDGADTTTKLENVKFTLTCNDEAFNVTKVGNYYVPGGDSNEVATDADGLIIIRGLNDVNKKYVLTETETNDGYNLLASPKELTNLVEDTGDTYVTNNFDQVENNKGTTLPSTGGIGTTIFYIIGGLLIVAAAVFFVVRRKSDAE